MKKNNIIKVMVVLLTALMILPSNFIFALEEKATENLPSESSTLATEAKEDKDLATAPEAESVVASEEDISLSTEGKTEEESLEQASTTEKTEPSESETSKTTTKARKTAKPKRQSRALRSQNQTLVLPDEVKIHSDIQPAVDSFVDPLKEEANGKQEGNPVIGVDHPQEPGEVMLFKEITPVAGKVNEADVKLRLETIEPYESNDIVVIIDISNFMSDGINRKSVAKAAEKLIDDFLSDKFMNTRIALVQFDTYLRYITPFTNDEAVLKSAVNDVEFRKYLNENKHRSNAQVAIRQAAALLENSNAQHKSIVMLSHGVWSAGLRLKKNYRDSLNLDSEVITYNDSKNRYEFNDNIPVDAYDSEGFDYDYSNPNNFSGKFLYRFERINKVDGSGKTLVYYDTAANAISEIKHIKATHPEYDIYGWGGYTGGEDEQNVRNFADAGKFWKLPSSVYKDEYFEPLTKAIEATMSTKASNLKIETQLEPGFDLVSIDEVSQGTIAQSADKFTWSIDALADDDKHLIVLDDLETKLHYAELTYRIRINENILPESIHEYVDAPQKFDKAEITYTDYAGDERKKEFPDESFDPVLYSLEVELRDQFGNKLNEDQDIEVSLLPDEGSEADALVSTLNLKTATSAKTGLLTKLKLAGTYSIETSLKPEDYTVTYYLNGKALDSKQFTVQNGKDLQLKAICAAKPSIKVSTTWQDAEDKDALRPEKLGLKLLANGEDTGKTLDLSEANKWSGTIKGFTVTEEEATYSLEVVEPSELSAYKFEVTGNRQDGLELKAIRVKDISGTVSWDDNADKAGKRPDSLNIDLLQNGEKIMNTEASAKTDWNFSFKGLPKYDEEGNLIDYSISQEKVDGYKATAKDGKITYTYEQEETSKETTKPTKKAASKTGESLGIYSVIGLSLLALAMVLAIIRKKFRMNPNQD